MDFEAWILVCGGSFSVGSCQIEGGVVSQVFNKLQQFEAKRERPHWRSNDDDYCRRKMTENDAGMHVFSTVKVP